MQSLKNTDFINSFSKGKILLANLFKHSTQHSEYEQKYKILYNNRRGFYVLSVRSPRSCSVSIDF